MVGEMITGLVPKGTQRGGGVRLKNKVSWPTWKWFGFPRTRTQPDTEQARARQLGPKFSFAQFIWSGLVVFPCFKLFWTCLGLFYTLLYLQPTYQNRALPCVYYVCSAALIPSRPNI
jgi:hypothetical protein